MTDTNPYAAPVRERPVSVSRRGWVGFAVAVVSLLTAAVLATVIVTAQLARQFDDFGVTTPLLIKWSPWIAWTASLLLLATLVKEFWLGRRSISWGWNAVAAVLGLATVVAQVLSCVLPWLSLMRGLS